MNPNTNIYMNVNAEERAIILRLIEKELDNKAKYYRSCISKLDGDKRDNYVRMYNQFADNAARNIVVLKDMLDRLGGSND